MTDARLRSEWLASLRHDALTDTAWRVFTSALMWSAENGTDGMIPARYTRYLHPDGTQTTAHDELTTAGLWAPVEGGFQMSDWDGELGQSTAAQVAAYRDSARERARTYRERQRKNLANANARSRVPESEAATVTRDAMSGETRDERAHVGKGKGNGNGASTETKEDDMTLHPSDPEARRIDWPVVSIPAQIQHPCRICGQAILLDPTRRAGICDKRDAEHQAARTATSEAPA